jgi:hypothetical protein
MITQAKQLRTAVLRAVTVAAVAATGCTTTSLVNMWKDPSAPRQPLNSVLVVTLRKSPTSRRLWEDGFVASLKRHGVKATPSYQLFPGAAPDTAALIDAVRSRGFDGLLVAHEVSATNETHYVSGYLTAEPVAYLSPWTGHYYSYYARVYAPGYLETDHVVRYETEVYETREGGQLVWSGTTESINPASGAQVNKEIAHVVVPELINSGVTRAH